MKKYIAIAVLALPVCQVRGEILLDVRPYDSYGEVATRWPKASVRREEPAWATEADAMFTFSGDGLPGSLIVVFHDLRPEWRGLAAKWKDKLSQPDLLPPKLLQEAEAFKAKAEAFANAPDEVALTVKWVRWFPASRPTYPTVVARYGPPSACRVDDQFENVCDWKAKALTVKFDSPKGKALYVETSFTDAERNAANKKQEARVRRQAPD